MSPATVLSHFPRRGTRPHFYFTQEQDLQVGQVKPDQSLLHQPFLFPSFAVFSMFFFISCKIKAIC